MLSVPFSLGSTTISSTNVVGKGGLTHLFSALARNCRSSISFDHLPVPFTYISRGLIGNDRMIFRRKVLTASVHSDVSVPNIFTPMSLSKVILISNKVIGGCPMSITLTVKTSCVVKISIRDPLLGTSRLGSIGSVFRRVVGLRKRGGCHRGLHGASILVGISIANCSTTDFAGRTVSALVIQKRHTTVSD